MKNLFLLKDFREVITAKLEENTMQRGYRARMSEAAGVQRSFLSHVLNSSVLLTPDHALGLCQFWKFNERETEYFLCLVYLSRSQTAMAKRYHEDKLRQMRVENEDLARRLGQNSQRLSQAQEGVYYSAWFWNAIHICTSIPKLRTPQAIALRLQLPLQLVQNTLKELKITGLVKQQGQEWRISEKHLHLPKDSSLTMVNHSNWRQKAISRIQSGDLSGLHYSVTYGISQKDAEAIRHMILDLIDKSKSIVEPSPEEDIFCFICDFFAL